MLCIFGDTLDQTRLGLISYSFVRSKLQKNGAAAYERTLADPSRIVKREQSLLVCSGGLIIAC